jgi:hypothetical protein
VTSIAVSERGPVSHAPDSQDNFPRRHFRIGGRLDLVTCRCVKVADFETLETRLRAVVVRAIPEPEDARCNLRHSIRPIINRSRQTTFTPGLA